MNSNQGPVHKQSTSFVALTVLLLLAFIAVLTTAEAAGGFVFGHRQAGGLPEIPLSTETTAATSTLTSTATITPTSTSTATATPTPTSTPTITPTPIPLPRSYLPLVAVTGSWTSQGLAGQRIRALVSTDAKFYAASQVSGAYKAGKACDLEWTAIGPSETTFALSILVDGNVTLVGTFNSKLYRRAGSGNWIQIDVGNPNIWVLAKGPDGKFYAGTDGGVFRSEDQGATWQNWGQGLSGDGLFIDDLLVDSAGNIWAATFGAGVFVRSSNGASWGSINPGLPEGEARKTWSLMQLPDGAIFVGTADGVFRFNSGVWSRFGLKDQTVYALATSDGTLFAGTRSSGVFMRTGTAGQWVSMDSGWPANTIVDDLLVYTSDTCKVIFAATGQGVVRYPLPH